MTSAQRMSQRFGHLFSASEHLILYLCLAYYVLMIFVAPGFFTVHNHWSLLFNLLPLLIVSVGQTLVMLTAGIDLSVTSVVALSSVVGGYVMSSDSPGALPPVWAITFGVGAMLLAGLLVGIANGLAVVRLGMPPFMVTLTTMIFVSGLAIWFTTSQNIYNLPEAFVDLPYQRWLGLPAPLYIGGAVVGLAYYVLNRTPMGQWLYAVGLNPKAARISGVDGASTLLFAYAVSGVCAAVASVLYTARLETGSPVMGQHILLDVIGAVVIGGTSLFGGKGKIRWTVYGVLFIVLLDNSLNLIGLSYFLIMMVKGSVILLAAVAYVWQERSGALVKRQAVE